MNKYVPIEAVIPFLPDFMTEEDNESVLLKYIWQGVRQNLIPYHKYDEKNIFICKINNYEVQLPSDIYKISYVQYTASFPDTMTNEDFKPWILEVINGNKVFIAQSLVFNQFLSQMSFQQMRYTGQDIGLFESDCINLFCNDNCVNFSVSKSMDKLKTDAKEGYVMGVYHTSPKNEAGDYIIPDDADLLQALAFFTEAKHWQSRSGRKEENAENMFITRMNMANKKFNEFNKKQLLKNFNPDEYTYLTQDVKNMTQRVAQRDRINNKKHW